jgi:cell division septation protein DedD
MSNITWIAVGAMVLVASGVLALVRRRGRRKQNYGAVSDQWIAQHRPENPYDS